MQEDLEKYILNHIDEEGAMLQELNRDTHLFHLRPRMCSGHLQGRLLKMFVRMIKPRTILELGTFTGYSALCLAEGLPEKGSLHTIEIDDELEDFIRQHFDKTDISKKIMLHVGDAKELLPQIEERFDLVFIDANKRDYEDYYNLVFDSVNEGGFIIADNTLWDGKVVEESSKIDAQTEGIKRFNELVARDKRVEKVIVPLRDGLTIIYKKPIEQDYR
ncbi:MAG: O-methyltransferase [Muribaculaceae bacterium]